MINGIAAAPFLLIVMLVSGDRQLMGRYANGPLAKVVGWFTTLLMGVAGIAGLYLTLFPPS